MGLMTTAEESPVPQQKHELGFTTSDEGVVLGWCSKCKLTKEVPIALQKQGKFTSPGEEKATEYLREWFNNQPCNPTNKDEPLGHMTKEHTRIPKKDDRVTVVGHEGVFVVYSVDHDLHSADLQQLGSDLRLATIPWDSITFLDAEKRKA
jgi:hypothetical protein